MTEKLKKLSSLVENLTKRRAKEEDIEKLAEQERKRTLGALQRKENSYLEQKLGLLKDICKWTDDQGSSSVFRSVFDLTKRNDVMIFSYPLGHISIDDSPRNYAQIFLDKNGKLKYSYLHQCLGGGYREPEFLINSKNAGRLRLDFLIKLHEEIISERMYDRISGYLNERVT